MYHIATIRHNSVMRYSEVRRQNLIDLIDGEKSAKVLADKAGTDAGYISQIKKGNRNMGDELARALEKAYKKDTNWMDFDHDAEHVPKDFTKQDVRLLYKSMLIVEREIPNASIENKAATTINIFCSEASTLSAEQIADAIKSAG